MSTQRNLIRCSFIVAFTFLCSIFASVSYADSAALHIKEAFTRKCAEVSEKTFSIMNNKNSSSQQKEKALEEILYNTMSVEQMAQFAASSFWNNMSEVQKNSYIKAYSSYMVKQYIPKIQKYISSDIKVGDVRELSKDNYRIKASIILMTNEQRKEPTNITFDCTYDGKELKIWNISAEGFSLLLNQKEEFRSIILREGVDNFITKLSQK
ncbi:Toluene tolerance, Ttg2 [Candidatus Fokinia solitaria]|uniref:Toluene tolerance, Ttg2 n=1 Tax=Candidatus Fokinia solitaria TaxID=1802984 RepID=A0A2U8BSM3_9RICK|nr:ABC transporter substrate-binding protein [Candidatus Fokinia solitaria]AWD33337.1 Toluene tolerance, Ttg2 [Candidatus Fokinia solitaria]